MYPPQPDRTGIRCDEETWERRRDEVTDALFAEFEVQGLSALRFGDSSKTLSLRIQGVTRDDLKKALDRLGFETD
jgi:hypothetical protein